jgi:hypothetical protein
LLEKIYHGRANDSSRTGVSQIDAWFVCWGVYIQRWHRSLLKTKYHGVLLTLQRVEGSAKFPNPTIPAPSFTKWLQSQAASTAGVPLEGVIGDEDN